MPTNPYTEDYEAQEDYAKEGAALAVRRTYNDAYRLNRQAHDPVVVQDMFRPDPGAVRNLVYGAFQPWKSDNEDFVESVERAMLESRGEVPWQWFMEQDPEDLLLLKPEIANQVYSLQEELAWKSRYEQGIQEETDQRMRVNDNLRTAMLRFNPIAIVGEQLTGEPWDPFGVIDDRSRDEIEQAVRNELQGTGDVSKPWIQSSLEWLMGGVGTVLTTTIEAAFRLTNPLATSATIAQMTGVRVPGDPFGIDAFEAQKQEQVSAAQADAALPDEVLMERLRPMVTEQAWQQLAAEAPAEHNAYMQMAGFDPLLAFSFFSDDLKELPEVQEQLRQIVNDPEGGYRADLNEFTQTLEEQDYRMSQTVLDGLAVYGKYVPMRLATALTILITDDDAASGVLSGRWETFHEQMAKADDSPARAVGIDGTAVGLLVDLGAGIAFDPTTWIFGPRATSMLGRANSRAGVVQVMDGPLVQRSLDDAVRIAYDPAAGVYEQTYVLNFLDETGHMGEALEVLGGVERTLPARPWITGDARALYTQDMNLGSVNSLLDPVDVARNAARNVDNLAESIRNNGFTGAIELTYSLRDGTFHVTDGLKRIKAANQLGLRSIPVTVRLTDTLKRVVQEGAQILDPAHARTRAIADVGSGSQAYAYQASSQLTDDVVERVLAGEETITRGGIAVNRLKATATQTATDPWVLVWDRTQLGPNMRQALDSGQDITNVSRSFGGETLPPPVFAYRPSQFDDLTKAAREAIDSGQPVSFGGSTSEIGPAGVAASSILQPGETLARLPESMGKVKPNLADGHYLRPASVLPKRVVLGQDAITARAELEKIVRRAMMDGATPPSAMRLVTAQAWNDRIRRHLRTEAGTDWIRRYMSPQHTITRFELHGPGAMQKLTETIYRIWGADRAKTELWLGRIFDYQKRLARRTSEYMDETAKLAPSRAAIKAMEDMRGGGWDDTLRFMEDELIPTTDVISGGQTGADIGGLQAAKQAGLGTGGMAPAGFRTEAGANPALAELGLRQSTSANYKVRTVQNVADADATIIFDPAGSTGSRQTLEAATAAGKPVLRLTGAEDDVVDQINAFLKDNNVRKVNIAGNRESVTPGIAQSVQESLGQVFRPRSEWAQAKANRAQLDEAYWKLSRETEKRQAMLDQAFADMPDSSELAKLIEDMWDDFNRTHIASKPVWREFVDPETGMVPWDHLLRGKARRGAVEGLEQEGARHFVPEELMEIARSTNAANPEKAVQRLSTVLHNQMAVNVPLSPLDLMVASETGGARWIRMTQTQLGSDVRESLWTLQKWWVMDKVFRPSTAITVSFDELMRIFHTSGSRGISEYLKVRADLMAARANAVIHNRLRRISAQRGMEHLSPRAQDRIGRLSNFQTQYKQAERQVYEGIGVGWDDIAPTDAIYPDAARRWFGDLLQDSGFRAYLKGETAFREWFTGPDGLRLRSATVVDKGVTGLLSRWQDAYQGWQTFFEKIVLSKATKDGRFADVMQAFRNTADQISATGGRPHDLPAWVFNHTGSVRGVRKHAPTRMGITRVTDSFFEHTFMNPVNFRRGFLADLIRETEKKRLYALFRDQGRQIMSDVQMEQMLSLQGLSGYRVGLRQHMLTLAKRNNVIPESYIEDLADARAMQEIDNVLYTWDQASRFGQQTRVAFPFGRPWADMAAFWGREVLTRPALRGWLNNRNAGNVSGIANALADRLPFNPKPVAMASRLAATDFSVDSLTPDSGLPLGAEEADFSPLLFMPTGGDNPFGSIIPGLGFLPMGAIDLAVTNIYDPVDQPVEYQALIDSIAQFIPAAAYNRGGFVGDVLGGGTTGTGIELLADAIGGISGVPFYDVTSQLGDIGREVDRTRELSALLADEEELAALMALTDPEEIDLYLRSLAMEADRRASIAHGAATLTRAVLPISAQYDTSLEQIQDVWLTAAERFPEDLRPTHVQQIRNDDDRRQAADDIRRQFFRLPQWKRDLYIAEYPALAVNLVGGWEWTPLAINELPEAQVAYRTGGTPEDLAQHQAYIDNRYIRPIQPLARAHRILGLMQASKESAAKRIYEFTAQDVNRFLWESVVSPEVKGALEQVLASPFAQDRGYTSASELWADWGTVEAEFEKFVAAEQGIDPNSEAFADLKSAITIPTKQQAWGSSWPGLNDEQVSQRFRELTINDPTPEVLALADGLGIDVTPGMTGLQLFQGVQEVITEVDTPLFGMMRPAYDDYVSDRSVQSTSWETTLRNQAYNPANDEEWRENVKKFFTFVSNLEHRFSEGGRRPEPSLSEQQAVVDQFQKLRMTSNGLDIDWDGVWEGRYQRNYGPLEWTPPEPAPVFLEDGKQNPNAYAPYIQRIVDGDTLIVSTAPGAAVLAGGTNSRPQMHTVRLLGVRAEELLDTDGQAAKEQLQDALMEALRTGDRIWLVRDPETFGSNTDHFGRELAWLWIGDTPFMFSEDFRRDETPSGETP